MLSFFRVLHFAFQDIVRNISLSFMTVIILVLMLLSINTLVVVRAVTEHVVSQVKEQIDVSVYFAHDIKQEQMEEIKKYISAFPEVVKTTFLDKEAVLAEFKETHKDNNNILNSLNELEENPLGATLIIQTREPRDYEKIITALSIPEYKDIIESKTFADTQKAIERISLITAQIEKAVLILSALFAIISFFVIFNTIRVAIYTQRMEIGIKKLVGATDWFVRGPYIIESIIFSGISMVIAGAIVYAVLQFLDPYLGIILYSEGFLTKYFQNNILLIVGIEFGVVLLLTIITSGLAMRKYLRI
ncbi:MAG: hypothetical protein CL685_04255 [Candidatus Magasanikbacteria bacterium]|nr:hypothetical protein [Candidatus Magasanikbacteria bacterium]